MPTMPQSPVKLVQHRPAESSGVVGAVVVIIAHYAGITDPSTLVALTVVVGALPSIVTGLILLLQRRNGGPQNGSHGP